MLLPYIYGKVLATTAAFFLLESSQMSFLQCSKHHCNCSHRAVLKVWLLKSCVCWEEMCFYFMKWSHAPFLLCFHKARDSHRCTSMEGLESWRAAYKRDVGVRKHSNFHKTPSEHFQSPICWRWRSSNLHSLLTFERLIDSESNIRSTIKPDFTLSIMHWM